MNSPTGTERVDDSFPLQGSNSGKELTVFVTESIAEPSQMDVGVSSPVFVSSNKFGVLENEEESSKSNIPLEGE